jgi:hypothetical protein
VQRDQTEIEFIAQSRLFSSFRKVLEAFFTESF